MRAEHGQFGFDRGDFLFALGVLAGFLGLPLAGAAFRNCLAREADFRDAGLTGADFSGADLAGA